MQRTLLVGWKVGMGSLRVGGPWGKTFPSGFILSFQCRLLSAYCVHHSSHGAQTRSLFSWSTQCGWRSQWWMESEGCWFPWLLGEGLAKEVAFWAGHEKVWAECVCGRESICKGCRGESVSRMRVGSETRGAGGLWLGLNFILSVMESRRMVFSTGVLFDYFILCDNPT